MRRADRLFLIIHALRGRRTALPARQLAETLGVSLRTVYRDVADLQLSGVPIEGEAGVGYVLRKGADIPPLMFSAEELESLVVGTRFVRAFAGERLAAGAQAALLKIEAVLPPELRARATRTRIYAPIWRDAEKAAFAERIDRLHAAIEAQRVLRMAYRDETGQASAREVEPLCLAFWGGKWTLGAWCRLRAAFRNFRPDRIEALEETGECFADVAGRNLDAYLQAMRGYYAGME
ncbi:helix-turn-helix transcriptional regulator [Fulvimonas soli]|jgi:predicted DNA-binding transcriptional regulator YafY|uniref:Putative DNA-binding transcriptional regulator YafY n=1 Tax=Fulvimonas soli TaxID=155197 RepID=A0A316IJC5_9GAMM|nr:YafY family protein [Fulvimonas soli]PWK92564.1 putative DNA-binding transcriptional regulator YafY [Fulvimonas soli]TNY27770.1 DNA-binding transcriptional regulator [Fulvimonas soli]